MSLRTFRNAITLRPVRKRIRKFLYRNKNKRLADEIQKLYPENSVLIIQKQFFDKTGSACFNGGAERYMQDLATVLNKKGYQAVLIQIGSNKIWVQQVHHLRVVGCPTKKNDDYLDVISNITKYKFVIYSGMYFWGTHLKHPNIMISHGITWDTPDKNVDVSNIQKILADVDNFVSVDTNTISWIRSTFSKSYQNISMRYIPNYVDNSEFNLDIHNNTTSCRRILFPRRASPERGYWLLSSVIPQILERYNDVVIDLVGFAHGDSIKNDIKKLTTQYGNRVQHFVVSPDKMSMFYSRSDITLIPTLYSEGTSLSCLEAMASGNVIIATNIGGLPNLIVDGYNGLLISPSEYELLNSIDKVLSNRELSEKLATNAKLVAKAFDKSIWSKKWSDTIDYIQ